MSMPNPIDNPELFDVISIGGIKWVSLCKITGGDREFGWDIKKAKGSAGGTSTLDGEEVSKFSVKFLLWLPSHFEAWDSFDTSLDRSVAKDPVGLALENIDLNRNGIISCSLLKRGKREDEGKGLHSYSHDFTENKPAKKSGGTPSATKGKGGGAGGAPGGGGQTNTAQDQYDQEIQTLLEKAKQA